MPNDETPETATTTQDEREARARPVEPTANPLPNTVCTATDLWSGSLDALAYDERTKFRNGTALVIDAGTGSASYALSVCDGKHLHVHVGLAIEVGQVSVLAVAAYALALAYDREHWAAGFIPSEDGAKAALDDCIAVLRERATERYADWLVRRCERELAGWVKRVKETGGALTPHAQAEQFGPTYRVDA